MRVRDTSYPGVQKARNQEEPIKHALPGSPPSPEALLCKGWRGHP